MLHGKSWLQLHFLVYYQWAYHWQERVEIIYLYILCDKLLLQVPVLLLIQLKICCKFKFWLTTCMYLYLQHIYWLPVDSNEVQLPMTSVPITTKVVSSNFVMAGCSSSIQHYVIKFVCGFFRVLRFPPPIKLTATILLKYCWKWR